MTTSNKLTKKELNQVFWRSFGMEWDWNYERQMNMAYCYCMLPVIKKLYSNKEDQIAAMQRHLEFFNTTPQLSTLILGISAAMEESNANDPDFDTESINSVKVSLMGPLAGIGDSFIWGTLRIIATGVGLSLANQGNILGPILFLLIFNIPAQGLRYYLMNAGYKLGSGFLAKIQENGLMSKLTYAASVLGLMVVGGIYFGDKCESEIYEGNERAWDLENYSVPEVNRIVEFAMQASKKRKNKVTSVDKSNVLATSRLWRRTTAKVAEKYPEITLENLYVDNCAMQLAINPSQFDVIVTGNLFGDILSDEAAVLSGSIGMLPSASIGESTSLYEPIHGSAPDIAGKGIANPLATILSAAMLLRYSLDEQEAATCIEQAVDKALAQGYRTPDLYKEGFIKADTKTMTEAVLNNI